MAKRPVTPKAKPADHDESRPWSPDSPQRHGGRHARELRTLEHAFAFLLDLEKKIMAVDQKIVDAQSALDASVATLTADVAALKANQGTQSAADVDAVVAGLTATKGAVDSLDASVKPTA